MRRVQAKQRPGDQPRRRANTLQHASLGRAFQRRSADRRLRVMIVRQRRGQCAEQRLQCGIGVRPLTTDLHFILLTNGQPHQTDQAVARRRFAVEVQL